MFAAYCRGVKPVPNVKVNAAIRAISCGMWTMFYFSQQENQKTGNKYCSCHYCRSNAANAALIDNRNTFLRDVLAQYAPVSHSAVSGGDGDSVSRLGESPSQRPSKVPAAYDVDAGAVLDDLVVLGRGQ